LTPSGTQRLVVDVIIPARNSASLLAPTLAAIPSRLVRSVVVVDNASTDNTAQVAMDAGAVVVREPRVGYGAACRRAVDHLGALPRPPEAVVFLAGDGSDDPGEIDRLLAPLRSDNAELVIGVRERDGVRRPRVRTKVALHLIGAIYRHQFEDLGPFRAIRFPALVALGMGDPAAGWNVEMQVKALKLGLHIVEVPVSSRPLERPRASRAREVASSVGATGRVLFQIFRHATVR
jgi:glycosyltransferase involved in cell wall biosynthesis